MARVGRGIVITPQQLKTQWFMQDHRFDLNLWNFEVSVGRAGVEIFQKSFDMGRFNSSGSMKWPKGKRRNKAGLMAGCLTESMSLYNSISYEIHKTNATGGEIRIFTDPAEFANTMSHKGFCFAAVHNSSDPSVRTGAVANMPQRQFMPTAGHDSSVFRDKLHELERMIFKGFPGVDRNT